MSDSVTHWNVTHQASLSFTVSWSLLKLMSIESVMPFNHLLLCCLLLLPAVFPSIRVFSSESSLCIRWPKYWSFSISPSSEYSGLISFRIDWLDLLAVLGTVKNLLQHHSSKASILEKEMATHSSILAWKIPWTKESGGLHSMGVTKSQTGLTECVRACAHAHTHPHTHTHKHTHTQHLDISQSDLQETKRLRLKLARQPPK